jgi:hypothetical protein
VPVVGDWNGDGRDDIGTFLASTATWTLRYGASPGLPNAGVFQFGARNQQPIVGDWNGDGIDGIGTFTKSTSSWTLRQTASAGAADAGTFRFGPTGSSSIAVAGDWNNDGRDGIGVFQTNTAQWTLRQTASSGGANAGSFRFGPRNTVPVVGDFDGPAAPENVVTTLVLPPVNIDLLGLEVRTSPITVNISSTSGDGKLLGNLLTTVTTLVDLDSASRALNTILDSTVDLLNSADLNISGLGQGPLDTAQASATPGFGAIRRAGAPRPAWGPGGHEHNSRDHHDEVGTGPRAGQCDYRAYQSLQSAAAGGA